MSDRQAAAAVRARIDWKFLLGLELTDPGCDFSLLSEFRDRNIAGGHPEHVLDVTLDRLLEAGLLKRPGRQRTDSFGASDITCLRTQSPPFTFASIGYSG
ncbi:hypothetical protein GCM10010365_75430 [Streptomyces poonensis]|uniref:Transposase InsH N-terminal domain-containing protein n=1 Tax=Streptomyces poonensis TaxID=68255 RepID=A0A918QGZ3_9ACTN|nr:hypothetical protein GCM10010365_75430 [Streptomyces poonensis]